MKDALYPIRYNEYVFLFVQRRMSDIITGERIQNRCAITCGSPGDFNWTPHSSKYIQPRSIQKPWNNPSTIFCYGRRLNDFRKILPYIRNPYTLYTHNSDENVTSQYTDIANHHLLKHWYAQNLLFHHPKVTLMPIGIANSIWPHGDTSAVARVRSNPGPKTKDFYFYFSLHTNVRDRILCYIHVKQKGIPFGSAARNYSTYMQDLSAYKYAICPPGNGVDSHRIWEALYVGVIPIMLRSVFTELIAKHVPCILLNTWAEFDSVGLLASYSPPNYAEYKDYLDMNRI